MGRTQDNGSKVGNRFDLFKGQRSRWQGPDPIGLRRSWVGTSELCFSCIFSGYSGKLTEGFRGLAVERGRPVISKHLHKYSNGGWIQIGGV